MRGQITTPSPDSPRRLRVGRNLKGIESSQVNYSFSISSFRPDQTYLVSLDQVQQVEEEVPYLARA